MLTLNSILLSLSILFLFAITSCQATVSCTVCPISIKLNLTTDTDLNLQGCALEEDEICSLILRVDYTDSNDTFALIGGTKQAMLILTNGEAQMSEVISIWFNELRVQRMVNIVCFAGTSCGVDQLKDIYKTQILKFDYQSVQSKLADQLYSSSASSSDLTCANPSGASVPCADGFCQAILDQNGFASYGNCVKKGPIANPYGIVITKTTMSDFGGQQGGIIYTCNKPMCNSKDNAQQVRQQLVAAHLIPQAMTTTTAIVPTSPYNKGLKNESNALLVFFFVFPIFTYFH